MKLSSSTGEIREGLAQMERERVLGDRSDDDDDRLLTSSSPVGGRGSEVLAGRPANKAVNGNQPGNSLAGRQTRADKTTGPAILVVALLVFVLLIHIVNAQQEGVGVAGALAIRMRSTQLAF
jgi:hypothetical protein